MISNQSYLCIFDRKRSHPSVQMKQEPGTKVEVANTMHIANVLPAVSSVDG